MPTPRPNRYDGSPHAIRPKPAWSSPSSSSASAASPGTPRANNCCAGANPAISTRNRCPGPSRSPSSCLTHSGAPVESRASATADGQRLTFRPCRERSEEHTSELQSPDHLVCRLLLEKKKQTHIVTTCDKTLH